MTAPAGHRCRRCGATSGLRRLMGNPLSLDGAAWECDGGCPRAAIGDHPHTDPGDGRTECDLCGKFVWPAIHSCKRVPVTEAARQRAEVRTLRTANERLQAMHREALDANAPLSGEVRDLRTEVERLTAQLAEATVKAAVTTGPAVQVGKCPNCAPGYDCESGVYTPDSPAAVEVELHRVAAEVGEPIEIVREMYDAIGACADEERIEREGNELEHSEFETVDVDGRRWWVLRGPTGAVSLTAAIVPADTALPPLSTALMVRDPDGRALFPDCFTAHRPGTATCPALPDGCDADGEAISGAAKVLTDWAAAGNDDDVIRDALVDVYRRELLAP